ncbi:TetR/AcrR family transcriptional regulator [Dyella sp.]|uniref:TetR/AcrR family transcriptional regulator n=1 Tax=Dyella sp. TaxID=1869338 RepID=UPI002B466770|nr:TetR/AcrR family transcriptional regulator [Dyella sp.]HKT30369.1 TetR/AcrR family transcriptional regulator [Dyella sp.]
MPLSAEHKQKTRQRIVECARELFNRRGFDDVSIDEIMQHAGLTRGGFYNHFKAKEDLYAEAVSTFMHFDPTGRWEGIRFDHTACGEAFARQIIEAYLSTAHLEAIENQCPMIALPSDTARAGPRVRQAYRCLVEHMANMLERGMDREADRGARQRSLAVTALCVGGMVLARTVDNPAFADEMRLAARNLALELIGSSSD